MSLPRVTNELSTVSQLDDRPNDTGGLTAAELKAKFDKDSETLKAYINNTLIPYLESSLAAAQLGVATIPGFSAADIQTALEQIAKAMQDVTQGTVTDGSITLAKLAAEVINAINDKQPPTSTLETLTNVAQLIAGSAAAFFPLNLLGTDYRASLAVMMQALKAMMLGNKSIATEQLKDAVVTSEKLAALAVLATHIAPGAVTGQKIATETIMNANYAPGSVTKNKLANDAKYLPFAERDSSASMYITSTWGGYLNYVVGDNDILIDSAEYGRLEDNWQADVISGNKNRVVTFTDIKIINVDVGLISETGGSVAIPMCKTLRIKKTPNGMLIGGGFAAPAIYSGTADPVGGNDGDIYIQYSE